jgi:hypothetical protein
MGGSGYLLLRPLIKTNLEQAAMFPVTVTEGASLSYYVLTEGRVFL